VTLHSFVFVNGELCELNWAFFLDPKQTLTVTKTLAISISGWCAYGA